ncbi:MAG TPA: hypothetical protein VJ204_14105 [Solirubrobacterales bacterium]|nr:hypothetical protein [Solirubrobacterales bacterium]
MDSYDELTGLIVGFDQWGADRDRLFALLGEETRIAKAGALYTDEVIVASQATWTAVEVIDEAIALEDDEAIALRLREVRESLKDEAKAGFTAFIDAFEQKAFKIPNNAVAIIFMMQWMRGDLPPTTMPLAAETSLPTSEPYAFRQGYAEYLRSPAGLKAIEEWERLIDEEVDADEEAETRKALEAGVAHLKRIRAGGELRDDFSPMPPPSAEAAVLSGVLGGLPAFPDADWDVILDVRERLGPARVNFRAAISTAAAELEDCEDPDQLADACSSLRRRVVAPALVEIEAELEDLGAIGTLLRVSQNAPTVGALATNLALVAGNPAGLGINAAAHALASAPIIASAAREIAHQRQKRRQLAARPFWLLREIDRKTS